MLKVVIIDDEPLIREGLCVILDWEKLGYEISGVADNGYSGYETIVDTKADVAIVDIMMPDMTGIELVEMLRKNNIHCKIIFLTAYADFEYAKKSIELDVYAYILKPLEEKELEEKLSSVAELIKKELNVSKMTEEKMIEKVIHAEKDIIEGIKSHHYEKPAILWDTYQLILLENDISDHNNFSNAAEIAKLINENLIFSNFYVFSLDGYTGLLTKRIHAGRLFRTLTSLQIKINKRFGLSPYIYVGDVVQNMEDISKTYVVIKNYMLNRFSFGYKKIIMCSLQELQKNALRSKNLSFNMVDLFDAVYSNHATDINDMLDEYWEYHKNAQEEEEFIKLTYYNLYTEISTLIMTRIPELKELHTEEKNILQQIHKINSLQELHGYMKHKILLLANEISELGIDTPIAKIIDYIDRNYDQNLKIEKIAEMMHYSSTYIGKMIKAELGESFNSYLNKKRIEKSMELLGKGTRVSEIAERVGYKDCNLFNAYFKKTTGFTPSEFRKSKNIGAS